MFQLLKLRKAIPSCRIHSLLYNNNMWTYVYAVEVPRELNNENKIPLLIYGHISDLLIKEGKDQHEDSINIYFNTLDEYLKILDSQRQQDEKFRKEWLENHPNVEISEFAIRNLENKNYSNEQLRSLDIHCISSVIHQGKETTKFAAI